jgi:lysophospholipase L1-like esterase
MGPDGCHFTPAGYDRLAKAVADSLRRNVPAIR